MTGLARHRKTLAYLGVTSDQLLGLTGLSLLAFLIEGVAIWLLAPLLSVLLERDGVASAQHWLVGAFTLPAGIGPEWRATVLVIAIVILIVLKCGAALGVRYAIARASGMVGHRLRTRLFERFLAADLRTHAREPSGKLLSLLATETWRVTDGLASTAALLSHICAVAVFSVMMVFVAPKLALVTAVGAVFVLMASNRLIRAAREAGKRSVTVNEGLAQRMIEGLAAVPTIRVYGHEDREIARFDDASDKVRREFLRLDTLFAVPPLAIEVLFAMLLGLLVLSAQDGGLVSLVVFLALLQRMQPHLGSAAQSHLALNTLEASVGALMAAETRLVPAKDDGAPAPTSFADVTLADVRFRYPDSSEVALAGVDFTIPSRGITALVGKSGSGKSTVLSLLCRMADPDEGAVLIGGQDLRGISGADWRSHLAIVLQDPYLFDASVAENIGYGRAGATQAEIEAAARAAGAEEFIVKLPGQYAAGVGPGGALLSGGQRQRIALARALVRDPQLLIFDEATNALDPNSERLVLQALARRAETASVLVVSHSMAIVEMADQVVVMEEGRVAEIRGRGTLGTGSGAFARLTAAKTGTE